MRTQTTAALAAATIATALGTQSAAAQTSVAPRGDAGRTAFHQGAELGRPALAQSWSAVPDAGRNWHGAVLAAEGIAYGVQQGAGSSTVTAVSLVTGIELWKRDVSTATPSLALDEGMLVVSGSATTVSGLAADSGELRWTRALADGSTYATPSLTAAHGRVHVGATSSSGRTTTLRVADGTTVWDGSAPESAAPAVTAGLLASGGACAGVAVRAATGARVWTSTLGCPSYSTFSGRTVASAGGLMVIGDGRITDLADGGLLDSVPLPEPRRWPAISLSIASTAS